MPTLTLENDLGRQSGRILCGVDEAGRGPLAGPVVAAAVVIPENFPAKIAKQINDSKKLTPQAREEIFPFIVEHCACTVTLASVDEIDTFNILRATLMAMGRAVESLQRGTHPQQAEYFMLAYNGPPLELHGALIDGNQKPSISCPAHLYVKGDSKSLSIAAASILAKVMRDRLMHRLHEEFPHYGFINHAGYGTPEHLEALRIHGPCPHHRQSFAPVRNCYESSKRAVG
jgi:ribonuclease HII